MWCNERINKGNGRWIEEETRGELKENWRSWEIELGILGIDF